MSEIWIEYVMPIIAGLVGLSGVIATFRYFIKSKAEIAKSAKQAAEETLAKTKGRIEADITPLVEKRIGDFTAKIEAKMDRVVGVLGRLARVDHIVGGYYKHSAFNTPELQEELDCLVGEIKELCKPEPTAATYLLERIEENDARERETPRLRRKKQGG